ncbi:hypothetical protein HS088_TW18G01025 [Tripterygium wilfordii]|uniref:Uncharacterized protein n=1 Tax=Tripterygium wilfordii TaxID=458696 RepID=A0A7J7CDT5_TRIWF|nr:hypothetical protein HS088_TW18G01025 [Tripterygium wilfordii]
MPPSPFMFSGKKAQCDLKEDFIHIYIYIVIFERINAIYKWAATGRTLLVQTFSAEYVDLYKFLAQPKKVRSFLGRRFHPKAGSPTIIRTLLPLRENLAVVAGSPNSFRKDPTIGPCSCLVVAWKQAVVPLCVFHSLILSGRIRPSGPVAALWSPGSRPRFLSVSSIA